MKVSKLNSLLSLIIVGGLLVFSSCDDGGGQEELPKRTGIFIANEGNFLAGNGSVSFYDEASKTISNNIIKNANDGAAIGSLVQSVFSYDGVGYLLCNDGDKVEFFSLDTYKFLANPENDISKPRYMTVAGGMGYISCWGPYDDNYGLPDSYIAVMDLSKNEIVDTLDCGSGPEGIVAIGNKLYVANSFETTVSVVDLTDNSSTKIEFDAAPQHFVPDANGNLWVSLSSGWQYPQDKAGVQKINTSNMEKGAFVSVLDVNGSLGINATGENIYILTTEAYPGTGSNVLVYSTSSNTLADDPLVSGESFYGMGYNLTTDKLYVSDSKAFAGPGQIYIYDASGTKLDEQVTSIGPNGFTFK